MFQLLLVCTGNTCRSPMAEWMLRNMLHRSDLDDRVSVFSAGLSAMPGGSMSPGTMRALLKRGIPLGASRHVSHSLSPQQVQEADLILTMTMFQKGHIMQQYPDAASKVYTLREYGLRGANLQEQMLELDIADPFGGRDDQYELTADEIGDACEKVLLRLRQELA